MTATSKEVFEASAPSQPHPLELSSLQRGMSHVLTRVSHVQVCIDIEGVILPGHCQNLKMRKCGFLAPHPNASSRCAAAAANPRGPVLLRVWYVSREHLVHLCPVCQPLNCLHWRRNGSRRRRRRRQLSTRKVPRFCLELAAARRETRARAWRGIGRDRRRAARGETGPPSMHLALRHRLLLRPGKNT